MAGMEGIGRLFDVIPIAAGVIFKVNGCSAVTFDCTGADTFTVTVGTSHSAAATDPGNIISHYYQRAATDGSAAWTKQTQSADNAVIQGSAYETLFTVLTSAIPGYKYIKCAVGGSGLVRAILHDLDVQRAPASLTILNA